MSAKYACIRGKRVHIDELERWLDHELDLAWEKEALNGELNIATLVKQRRWSELMEWQNYSWQKLIDQGRSIRPIVIDGLRYSPRKLTAESPDHEVIRQLALLQIHMDGYVNLDSIVLQAPLGCEDPFEFVIFFISLAIGFWSFDLPSAEGNDAPRYLDDHPVPADPDHLNRRHFHANHHPNNHSPPSSNITVKRAVQVTHWMFETLSWLYRLPTSPSGEAFNNDQLHQRQFGQISFRNINILLWLIGACRGRVRRLYIPVIVTMLCSALVRVMHVDEALAWDYLQALMSTMTRGLRQQLVVHIESYRRLGFWRCFEFARNVDANAPMDDRILKKCTDLLNGLPHFLWSAARAG